MYYASLSERSAAVFSAVRASLMVSVSGPAAMVSASFSGGPATTSSVISTTETSSVWS